jgi:hypothetical protein
MQRVKNTPLLWGKQRSRVAGAQPLERKRTHQLLEIARVLVRFDHVARFIVNANHGIM